MKEYKIRIFIYAAAFIVTAALTYLFKISDITHKSENTSMGSAALPVVYMISDEGCKYNYLYGYISDVNYAQMHGVITPVATDRNVKAAVKTYGTDINGISYEVRDLSGTELIEKNTITEFGVVNGIVSLDFKLKNLLTTGKEYMLKIKVNTNKYGEASYYSRIVLTDNANVDKKINYVKKFCTNTMSEDTLKEVVAKLEPDSTGDNTNLGHVNIHSKLSQVGFGPLVPEPESEIYPQINEIDGNVASITLKYNMGSSENDRRYNYRVTEFYRINQVSDTVTYVYAFDRFIDQIFNPEYGVNSKGNIYLGISPTEEREVKVNSTGTVTAFVEDGNLWSYHSSRDRFNKVFSFDEADSDGFRESNQEHDIKIMSVDKNGNIYFLVYGYMNRGIHEGQIGIAAYYYSAEKNTTEELVFVPSEESYMVLEKSIEKLAYINDHNILYFYQNRSIYYLNYETRECMLIDSNVIPKTCMMSSDYILVYQTGNNENDCNRIKIIDLKTGNNQYIDASGTERIKVLGFIDNNIVYGIADKNLINRTGRFAMKSMYIVDENKKIVREYANKDIYILDTFFYDTKIIIKRASFNEEGVLEAVNDDQLLSNSDELYKKAEIKTASTEERQKELYIKPVLTGSTRTNMQNAKYIFPLDASVYINNEFDVIEEYYYVFTYGKLYYFDTDFELCKEAAKNTGGVVVDKSGTKIWDRYMDKKTS